MLGVDDAEVHAGVAERLDERRRRDDHERPDDHLAVLKALFQRTDSRHRGSRRTARHRSIAITSWTSTDGTVTVSTPPAVVVRGVEPAVSR